MVVLLAAALALVALTWQRGYEARTAIGVGVLVAGACLIDSTAIVVVPFVAIGALGPLWTRGTVARRYIGWIAQAATAAALVVGPWMLWDSFGDLDQAGAPGSPRTASGVALSLVKLHEVARRVGQERLAARPHRRCVAHLDAAPA